MRATRLARGVRSDDWGDDAAARSDERHQILGDHMLWAPPAAAAIRAMEDMAPDKRERLLQGFVDHPGRTVLDPARMKTPVSTQMLSYVSTTSGDEDPYDDLPVELATGVPESWRLATLPGGHWPMIVEASSVRQLLMDEAST